jgi:hypothetical protein
LPPRTNFPAPLRTHPISLLSPSKHLVRNTEGVNENVSPFPCAAALTNSLLDAAQLNNRHLPECVEMSWRKVPLILEQSLLSRAVCASHTHTQSHTRKHLHHLWRPRAASCSQAFASKARTGAHDVFVHALRGGNWQLAMRACELSLQFCGSYPVALRR